MILLQINPGMFSKTQGQLLGVSWHLKLGDKNNIQSSCIPSGQLIWVFWWGRHRGHCGVKY